MHFTLCQIRDQRLHTFQCYDEVVESVRWGLVELGHTAEIRHNFLATTGVNIAFGLFGTDAVSLGQMEAMPSNVIAYNFEQMAGANVADVGPAYAIAARKMLLWDYSAGNLPVLQRLNPARPPVHVPIGWAPTLSRIPSRPPAFDVLIYGMATPRRLEIFEELSRRWIRSVFVCGLYGEPRDELIGQAKLVLNVSRVDGLRVFETVRVSYLLGNGKVVVSEEHPDYEIDPDLRQAVVFCKPGRLVEMCEMLLGDRWWLSRQSEYARRYMTSCDIRPILQRALEQSGIS